MPAHGRQRQGFWVNFWRIWLPCALCLIGVVVLVADGFDLFGVDAFAAFVGAGLSVALTNVLWRIGISGNTDRDDEEDARRYLAEHGRWPEDRSPQPPEAGRASPRGDTRAEPSRSRPE